MVYMGGILNGQLAATVLIMCGFTLARLIAGKLDRSRRVTFENTALLAYYTAAQALFGLVLTHGFPRIVI
jgi:cytochrome c oxidase subunit I+III